MNKKQLIQLAALVLIVYLACFMQLHLVRDEIKDGVLIWNSDEAFLFANWSRAGYHFSCIGYLAGYIPALFGVNHTYDDMRSSVIVIRITPNGTERLVTEREYVSDKGDHGFRAYFPLGQTIYAFDGGDPWKWAGTRFERVRTSEPYPIKVVTESTTQQEFENVDGWSARRDVSSWPVRSSINLDNKPIAFFLTRDDSSANISLKLQLPNTVPQILLQVNNNLHLVRRSTYKSMFEHAEFH